MNFQICTNCVLDTSEKKITFDEKGVCHYCNEYFEISKQTFYTMTSSEKSSKLKNYVDLIKKEGQGKEYDCIIGLSGGVDSSYVAYVVKQHGLRPLAVHLDNGWNAELAVKNIENICKKLDIDLYTHVINWEEFKDLQLSFLKASVANAEAPTDHAIFAILYKMARKYNIRWIIDGVNHATEYCRTDGEAGGYAYSDLKQIVGIHRKFGNVQLKTYPMMSYWKKLYYKHFIGVKQFSILDYVDYNNQKALIYLSSELGWRSYGAKHHESLYTKWHQVVNLSQKFKYDKRKAHLSDLILSNQLSRQQALETLEKPPIPITEKKELEEYVMKKLGLDIETYQKFLNEKPKSYKDYPNDEWIINLYKKYKQFRFKP
jgi:N-acetyl sugar amidotransferase